MADVDAAGSGAAPATHASLDASDTPDRWRALALLILIGGFVLGERASRSSRALAAGFGVAGAVAAGVVPIAAASRRPPIPPQADPLDPAAPPPTFSVLVAARDEASVLPQLIADLAAQDHRTDDGRALFELVVIDDRSVDGTAQVALRAAAGTGLGDVTRLVRRSGDGLADGKGAALAAVPPSDCRGDVVVVLDADARVGPSFLSTLARYVLAGAEALTARRRILDADSSHLAGAQADEQTLDGEIQRGRWALGGCSEFRGNGIVVRRDLLSAAGGWRAEALTEDIDLSSRIAARQGVRVAWAMDAEVWEEPVRDWRSLWKQRVRWAEGGARRLLDHGFAVLTSRRLSIWARVDFAIYAGQLLAPPFVVGTVFGALRHGRAGSAALLAATYAATGGLLGWDALRWERRGDGSPLARDERLRRAVRVALFNALWLAAVPAALWRLATRHGAVRYDKMEHGRAGE